MSVLRIRSEGGAGLAGQGVPVGLGFSALAPLQAHRLALDDHSPRADAQVERTYAHRESAAPVARLTLRLRSTRRRSGPNRGGSGGGGGGGGGERRRSGLLAPLGLAHGLTARRLGELGVRGRRGSARWPCHRCISGGGQRVRLGWWHLHHLGRSHRLGRPLLLLDKLLLCTPRLLILLPTVVLLPLMARLGRRRHNLCGCGSGLPRLGRRFEAAGSSASSSRAHQERYFRRGKVGSATVVALAFRARRLRVALALAELPCAFSHSSRARGADAVGERGDVPGTLRLVVS